MAPQTLALSAIRRYAILATGTHARKARSSKGRSAAHALERSYGTMGRKIKLFDDADGNRLDPLWRPIVGHAAPVDDWERLGTSTEKIALKAFKLPRQVPPSQ